MGVYIKGMEMPKSCYHCVWMFRDKPNEKVYCTATETDSNIFAADQWLDISDVLAENRHSSCPLIPVPPHGRLIDADAYSAEMKKRQDACAAWRDDIKEGGGYGTELYFRADSALAGFCEARMTLDKIPTIIPAEEGE